MIFQLPNTIDCNYSAKNSYKSAKLHATTDWKGIRSTFFYKKSVEKNFNEQPLNKSFLILQLQIKIMRNTYYYKKASKRISEKCISRRVDSAQDRQDWPSGY